MSHNEKNPFADNDATVVASDSPLQSPFNAPAVGAPTIVDPSAVGGDNSSDKTLLHDQLMSPLAPLAKLVVLDGIEQGEEFTLVEPTVTFGRERDNTISFPDPAVSRYHFKIHQREGHYVLEDLGSGNGTAINSKRHKKETVKLSHGDRIQVGKALIQFRVIGESLTTTGGGSSKGLVFALLLAVLLIGGGAFAYMQLFPPVDEEKINKQQAQELLETGINHYKQRKWRDAKFAFHKALRLDPKNPEITQRLNDVKSEEMVAQKLRKAKIFFKRGNYKDALQATKEADQQLAAGSVFADTVWNLRFKIEQKIPKPTPRVAPQPPPKKRVVVKRSKIYRFYSKRKRRYIRYYKEWTSETKRWKKIYLKAKERIPPKRPEPPVERRPVAPKIDPGITFYRVGQIDKALKHFKKTNQTEKYSNTKKFQMAFRKGRLAHNNRNTSVAIPALLKSFNLDREIADGNSRYTRQIRMMLANMYVSRGLLSMSRQQNGIAFRHFQTASRYYPRNSTSKAKLKELRALAAKYLKDGEQLLASNPAQGKQLLRKASRFVPRTDKIFKKAQNLLNK
ncbi:MAG: hypothetical protein CL920_17755 [Deltaproteobacteria bacterium]|nr:hypothetical protein [Deltaproteobacteria bacterium]|tara:strand:- start:4466 stop:6160 length:1695 start_codon:yes stop_codon:yes gene_type:complete